VPAVVNVCDALFPFCSTPVLKLPSLAVAVCALGPWLTQVTVSPTWIVIVAGVNWKSAIVTVVAFAAWAIWCRVPGESTTSALPARLTAGV